MKISFVYDAVYPWEKGGAQKRIWELAHRLADNHDVHLYGMHYWDGPNVIEREGVTLHGVCEPKDLYTDGRRSIPQAMYFAAKVTPALLREDFDVIDCQEFPYFPCYGAKLHQLAHGTTLVITWYEVWDEYWYDYLGWKGVFGKIIERGTARLADEVVPISELIKDDLVEIGRKKDVTVVPNGVDYHGLQKIPEADTPWDIIYVGRLSEHKNVDILLEAVDIVREDIDDLRCCIIGDGPERDTLEQQAINLGLGEIVEFLGFVEADADVIANIKAARVFVLPSEREGFPNTILEANACGVPSIVINHPENGATAVVNDGETGIITELSAGAIANDIIEVLRDESLHQQLATRACEFGREHDWDVIVNQLEDVYTHAIEGNN